MPIEHILKTDSLNIGRIKTNGIIDEIDRIKFDKGTLPANTNYDTLLTPGNYYTGGQANVDTSTGLAVKLPSSILVFGGGSVFSTTQIQVPNTRDNNNFYVRSRVNSSTWSVWTMLGRSWNRGELPLNTNVYDMRGPDWVGVWNVSGAATSSTIQGELPPGMTQWLPGQFEVRGSGGGSTNLSTIIYTPYSSGASNPKVFMTTIRHYAQTGRAAWSDWVDVAAKPTSGGGSGALNVYSGNAGVPNVARLDEFKEMYPLASTGNKGAVMFRYDHGLTNFKALMEPLHTARNIPYCIAMNSRKWSDVENSGATQADVKSWIATGLCEIWNHSATHEDTDIAEELYDIIVNGRIELEQQLGVKVPGFIVPGMSPTGMGGLNGGSSLDVFSITYAGTLILAYHAVTSGAYTGTARRKLDGIIRQGQNHYTFEGRTVAQVKAEIDKAISEKTALQLMMHPRLLNMSGYITTADLTEILDYVKSKVDGGQLVALSPYQSLHAKL